MQCCFVCSAGVHHGLQVCLLTSPGEGLRGRRGGGGSVGTPIYIPQNDPHDALIILNIHKCGKDFFKKKYPSASGKNKQTGSCPWVPIFSAPPPPSTTILGLPSPPPPPPPPPKEQISGCPGIALIWPVFGLGGNVLVCFGLSRGIVDLE